MEWLSIQIKANIKHNKVCNVFPFSIQFYTIFSNFLSIFTYIYSLFSIFLFSLTSRRCLYSAQKVGVFAFVFKNAAAQRRSGLLRYLHVVCFAYTELSQTVGLTVCIMQRRICFSVVLKQ